MRGYKLTQLWAQQLKETTELCSVYCNRCRNIWQEEVTHFGFFAGYARTYDCCEKCITKEEKDKLGIKNETQD